MRQLNNKKSTLWNFLATFPFLLTLLIYGIYREWWLYAISLGLLLVIWILKPHLFQRERLQSVTMSEVELILHYLDDKAFSINRENVDYCNLGKGSIEFGHRRNEELLVLKITKAECDSSLWNELRQFVSKTFPISKAC